MVEIEEKRTDISEEDVQLSDEYHTKVGKILSFLKESRDKALTRLEKIEFAWFSSPLFRQT